jgi:Flp pilus assembly protein TadD
MQLHRRLADLNARVGNQEEAVRERAAVVALGPPDRAEALYLLAVAQRDAGDGIGARRSVLRALEIAPNYQLALELLLELRAGAGGGAP